MKPQIYLQKNCCILKFVLNLMFPIKKSVCKMLILDDVNQSEYAFLEAKINI
jgi:hypothetical protein